MERAPWSVDQTLRLCAKGSEHRFLGKVRLLDTSMVASVGSAVDLLNRGVLSCPEDLCAVFSASSNAYFVLFRQGCGEKVIAYLGLSPEELPNPKVHTLVRGASYTAAPGTPGAEGPLPPSLTSTVRSMTQVPVPLPSASSLLVPRTEVSPDSTSANHDLSRSVDNVRWKMQEINDTPAPYRHKRLSTSMSSQQPPLTPTTPQQGAVLRHEHVPVQNIRTGSSLTDVGLEDGMESSEVSFASMASVCASPSGGGHRPTISTPRPQLLTTGAGPCRTQAVITTGPAQFPKAQDPDSPRAGRRRMCQPLSTTAESGSPTGARRQAKPESSGAEPDSPSYRRGTADSREMRSPQSSARANRPPPIITDASLKDKVELVATPVKKIEAPEGAGAGVGSGDISGGVGPWEQVRLESGNRLRRPSQLDTTRLTTDHADSSPLLTKASADLGDSSPRFKKLNAETDSSPRLRKSTAETDSSPRLKKPPTQIIDVHCKSQNTVIAGDMQEVSDVKHVRNIVRDMRDVKDVTPKYRKSQSLLTTAESQEAKDATPKYRKAQSVVAPSESQDTTPKYRKSQSVLAPADMPDSTQQHKKSPSSTVAQEPQDSDSKSQKAPSNSVRVIDVQAAEDTDEVEIGGRTFRLIKVIGRGAFGVVWQAKERDKSGEHVAVKAVTAKTSKAFATAVFEAELLRLLTAQLPTHSWDRVPRYIAHGSSRTSSGGNVRLAMSFVRGFALDQWLYGIGDEEHKHVDVSQLVEGGLPGGRQLSMKFSGACNFARGLVSQLAGVFMALQPIALHRDVSSHNVLVDLRGGDPVNDGEGAPKPNFALIDFGLAVRSGSWHKEWCSSNLAGDPRYWAPPAWMAFAFGFRYVETHPNRGFHRQYLTKIDHFGLGVLGLEVLFALWNCDDPQDKPPGMQEARRAWCILWDAVIRLFQMFHRKGPQVVRQHLARSPDEGVACVANHLRTLRQALRGAASEPANTSWASLLHVLADLVDERGVLSWAEIPTALREESGAHDAPSPLRRRPIMDSQPICSTPKTVPVSTSSSRQAAQRRARSSAGDDPLGGTTDSRRPRASVTEGIDTVRRYDTLASGRTSLGVSSRARSPSLVRAPCVNPGSPAFATHQARLESEVVTQRGIADAHRASHATSPRRPSAVQYVAPVWAERKQPHSYVPPPGSYVSGGPSYVRPPEQSASYVPLPVGKPATGSPSWVPPPSQVVPQPPEQSRSWVPLPTASTPLTGSMSWVPVPQVLPVNQSTTQVLTTTTPIGRVGSVLKTQPCNSSSPSMFGTSTTTTYGTATPTSTKPYLQGYC